MSDLIPIIARAPKGDDLSVQWAATPNFAAGNKQFFDPHPRCLIQVRPLLKADLASNGAGREANAILWIRGEQGGTDLAYYVRIPTHLRKNNRAGIMCGIKCVRRFDRELGRDALAVASRTRWPKPEHRAWTA
ncbi:hypothetical protein ASG52_05385 [Methylobacterium sp. Leaf456]|uniref:hypothetical protein n=1 Tax=Methylobacterium sp. Leaf456 TaxID=1736382 RepID=UPI0006FA1AD0|nr:hypothetical protein [Methylobacterium sp. Leaf456]KQT53549.1 hypothetical protein ASG52_05385 [Methylobacterium sp. Leaf456]